MLQNAVRPRRGSILLRLRSYKNTTHSGTSYDFGLPAVIQNNARCPKSSSFRTFLFWSLTGLKILNISLSDSGP